MSNAKASKPPRHRCKLVVRPEDAHLYPDWWPLMDASTWRTIVEQALGASYVEGVGMVADPSLNRIQTCPDGLRCHTGWHTGHPHWCFDLRGDSSAWVVANVSAIRAMQTEQETTNECIVGRGRRAYQ